MQWGNAYDKHSVLYCCVASSRQIPMLLQDTIPYVVPEIWENTLPLFNPRQYSNKSIKRATVQLGLLVVQKELRVPHPLFINFAM